MKSDRNRGSSLSPTRLDGTGLNVTDSDCHWRLNTALTLRELTYNIGKLRLGKRFIGSERYWYRSKEQTRHQHKDKNAANKRRLIFNILDSRWRGFV